MKAKNIGENIKKYREEKGYTRIQFAELIDRTYNTLRNYECGNIVPSPYALTVMAITLGVSVQDILRD